MTTSPTAAGGRPGTWWAEVDGALRLSIRVLPGARRSEIVGVEGGALRIRVAAPARDNKANDELVRFVAKAVGVPKRRVTIERGATSREKVVQVDGQPAGWRARLGVDAGRGGPAE